MKSFKKLLAFLLAAIMLLSVFTVCAGAAKSVKWEEYPESTVVYYNRGRLKTDKNTLTYSGKSAYLYIAPKEGVYSISFSMKEKSEYEGCGYSWLVSEKAVSNKATGFDNGCYSDAYGDLFYLKKGEQRYIGIMTEGKFESYTIKIKYLGKVKDVELENKNIPLQANMEIDLVDDGVNGNQLCFSRNLVFTTDYKKSLSVGGLAVSTSLKTLKDGKVTARINALGIDKKLTFSVFSASSVINKISTATGFVKPTVTVDSDGNLSGYEIGEESLKVKIVLSDGKKVDNAGASEGTISVKLSDGRKVVLYPSIEESGGSIKFIATDNGAKNTFVISDVKKVTESSGDEPSGDGKLSLKGIITAVFTFFSDILKRFEYFKAIMGNDA